MNDKENQPIFTFKKLEFSLRIHHCCRHHRNHPNSSLISFQLSAWVDCQWIISKTSSTRKWALVIQDGLTRLKRRTEGWTAWQAQEWLKSDVRNNWQADKKAVIAAELWINNWMKVQWESGWAEARKAMRMSEGIWQHGERSAIRRKREM